MRRVLLVLLAIAILPSPAAAQECIDYGDILQWRFSGGGAGVIQVNDVVVAGSYAYVTWDKDDYNRDWDFEVYDLANPGSPYRVGRVATPYSPRGLAVFGAHAYVADGNGLRVIDVSSPTSLQIVGSVDTPGFSRRVVISGNYAYVTDGSAGLQVIDISNPSSPQLAGGVLTPGYAQDVAVSDDFAYVADGLSFGLQVIDISDPAAPQIVGSLDTPGLARGVTVSGDYAYVADESAGLQVIDVSSPSSPVHVGSMDTPGGALDVTVSGSYAYVAQKYGLRVIDISDPASPQLFGEIVIRELEGWEWITSVAVSGSYAYLGGDGDLHVIGGIPGLENPPPVGSVDTPGRASGVTVSGDFAYVADERAGLQVIDVSSPSSPVLVGSVDTPGFAYDVTTIGSYAYVAHYSGLRVIDIADPSNPQIIGGVATGDLARGVTVSGDYAYVANSDSGLYVIEVSSPTSPQIVGSVDTPGSAWGVTVSGDFAYVADWDFGLQVIDISNPASPQLVGAVDNLGRAYDVTVSGSYAYVRHEVIDISNPASPQIVGFFYGGNSVAIFGNYAYGVNHLGLSVSDISDPASSIHSTLVGRVMTDGESLDVALSGSFVYVAGGEAGLLIAPLQCDNTALEVTIDIKPGSDPNSIHCKGNPGVVPVAVMTTDTFDALTIDHTTVRFGPGGGAEVHMRKGPKPNGNGALSLKPTSGEPKRHEEDVDGDGDFDLVFHFARAETGIVCGDTEAVLTGQTYDGQSIFGSDTIQTVPEGDVEPEPDGILRVSPNPFNPATSIAFVVSEPQHVTVRIYDVRGQLVAELADGTYSPGRHVLEWRGRDTAGRVVSSGMYFFRVDRGGQVEIRKALLIK